MIRESDHPQLDALDKRIVELLQADARRRNVEIARILSVSEKTVRNRIERLVSEHGMRFHGSLPERGHATRVVYLITAAPGTRFELAREIAHSESVSSVHLTNGAADLVVSARFEDGSAALEFSVRQLESDPRIIGFEECTIIRDVSDDEAATEPANVPRIDRDHLGKALIQIPEFRTTEDSLWWLARLLKRAFAADHIMVTTALPDELTRTDVHLGQHIITLDLPNEYVEALTQRVTEDGGQSFSLVRRALETRQHSFVEDARSSVLLHLGIDLIPLAGYVSVVAFPMLYGDILLGAAVLYYDRRITTNDEFIGSVQRALDFFVVATKPMSHGENADMP